MGTILTITGKVFLFILKALGKILLSLGALALCTAKLFLMLLVVTGQIVLGIVRLGESV